MSEKILQKTREFEARINQNLFFICSIVTIVTIGLVLADFFSRGSFLPSKINFFYLGVLVIYALHKEFVRWLGYKKATKNGEYFVYIWIILTTALYVINFLSRDYFNYSIEGYRLGTLRDVSVLTLEVLVVFISTRCLKLLRVLLKSKKLI